MSFSREEEINKSIYSFIDEFNIDITNEQIQKFIKKDKERKNILLPLDIFLNICKFLHLYESVQYLYTCKYYNDFEKYIWSNSYEYKKYFPHSIIKNDEYNIIKNNIALERYYYTFYNIKDKISDLPFIEEKHLKCKNELKNIDICNDYNYKLISYTYEKKSYEIEIDYIKKKLCPCAKKFFTNYQLCSIDKYYTIKQNIDMRMYGFNPEKKEDVDYWTNTGVKWIKREITENMYYNVTEIEYNNGIEDIELYSLYFYDEDDDTYNRYYSIPEWCSFLLN